MKELVDYQCYMVKAGKFAPDLTFDLDRAKTIMRFKTESLIFFFACDGSYFRRLGFEPYVLEFMDKKGYMITIEMHSNSRATL